MHYQRISQKIEKKTTDLAECNEWKSERRKRMTASKVGGICKMRGKNQAKQQSKGTVYSEGTRPQDVGQKWRKQVSL